MIKTVLVGLLVAMVGVCFADYKELNVLTNLNDTTKIDKCLAEATAAKDEKYITIWNNVKLVAAKDSKSITYEEFKKLLKFDKLINSSNYFAPQVALKIKRFQDFIPNVLNDPEFKNGTYVSSQYSHSSKIKKMLGFKKWRETFINLKSLKNFRGVVYARRILHYYSLNSDTLTADEIKADCAIFKRAWYSNISKSEDWKKLLVQIELLSKSVQ